MFDWSSDVFSSELGAKAAAKRDRVRHAPAVTALDMPTSAPRLRGGRLSGHLPPASGGRASRFTRATNKAPQCGASSSPAMATDYFATTITTSRPLLESPHPFSYQPHPLTQDRAPPPP